MPLLKNKTVAVIGAAILVLALAGQFEVLRIHFATLSSYTNTSTRLVPRQRDLKATVQIERPLARWIPFLKVGDTVYRHSYQRPDTGGKVLELEATTLTHVVILGFCSPRQYDRIADAPFEKAHSDYQKEFGWVAMGRGIRP